jgi:hypothetical protein
MGNYKRQWLTREEKSRYEYLAEKFEQQNGYPYSWYEFTLRRTLYREAGEPEYYIRIHPYMISIGMRGLYASKSRRYKKRQALHGYSVKSRCALHSRLLMVRWDTIEKDKIRIGTLTYPRHYPKDGQTVKRHLRNILKRLMRFAGKYGSIAVVWKLEFQGRGAPHFHLLAVSGEKMDLTAFRPWLAHNWAEVVNAWTLLESGLSGEEKKAQYENHLKAGTQLSEIKNTLGSMNYFSFYIGKGKKAKEHQHRVPEEYKNVGRWWGLAGDVENLIPAATEARIVSKEVFDKAWKLMETRLLAHGVKPNPYATGKRLFLSSFEETQEFISCLFPDSARPQEPEGKI